MGVMSISKYLVTKAKCAGVCATLGVLFVLHCGWLLAKEPIKPVESTVSCNDERARDQDDLCIWVHPTNPAQSAVIAADKAANRLWVYDLTGKTLQSLPAKRPGNIDVRY